MIRDERQWLIGRLRDLAARPGSTVAEVFPTAANFVLVRVAGGEAASAGTARRLLEAGVLIKDVGRMHPLLANCLRLTVGTPDENRLLIEALGEQTGP